MNSTLIAGKLLAVQPLPSPKGLIFYHKFRYGEKKTDEPVYKKPRLVYRDVDAPWWGIEWESTEGTSC